MVGALFVNELRPTALCSLKKKKIIGIYTRLTRLKELKCLIDKFLIQKYKKQKTRSKYYLH